MLQLHNSSAQFYLGCIESNKKKDYDLFVYLIIHLPLTQIVPQLDWTDC